MTTNQTTHIVYQLIETQDKAETLWNKIGVAWEHKDQKGLNIQMNAMPLVGKIVIRKHEAKEQGA